MHAQYFGNPLPNPLLFRGRRVTAAASSSGTSRGSRRRYHTHFCRGRDSSSLGSQEARSSTNTVRTVIE